MKRRIIIVGPSGSGKTTVAEVVARELGLPLVSMDAFRARGLRLQFYVDHAGQKVRNYEDPRMWDPNAIACKLRALITTGHGFVAEGNHLLRYPEIAGIPNAEWFYVDVPHAVSLARRKTRHRYLPADESFALIGEEQTKIQVEPQRHFPGVRVLDGTRPPADVAACILYTVPLS